MTGRYRSKFKQFDEDGNLLCYSCKQYKPLDCFDKNIDKWFRAEKDSRCKECKRNAYLRRKEKNRGSKDLNRLLYERFHALKDRARKKDIQCNIDLQYLHELWNTQKGLCALSGIPMTYYFDSGRVPTNVSVDRINSNLGYIKGNLQLVCMAVNQMKSDLTIEQLKYFCKSILEYK